MCGWVYGFQKAIQPPLRSLSPSTANWPPGVPLPAGLIRLEAALHKSFTQNFSPLTNTWHIPKTVLTSGALLREIKHYIFYFKLQLQLKEGCRFRVKQNAHTQLQICSYSYASSFDEGGNRKSGLGGGYRPPVCYSICSNEGFLFFLSFFSSSSLMINVTLKAQPVAEGRRKSCLKWNCQSRAKYPPVMVLRWAPGDTR